MEPLFYVYFRKWCSRVSQIAFHDCRKKLQHHVFSRIVHLASTRASVMESSRHYSCHNLWLCLQPRDFGFTLKIGKACIHPVKLVFLRSWKFGFRFYHVRCYQCPMYYFHCVCSYLEMLLYALLLCCFCMAPKAVRFITARELQEKYGSLLSQPPYSECTSFTYLHRALQDRKPPIHITVS